MIAIRYEKQPRQKTTISQSKATEKVQIARQGQGRVSEKGGRPLRPLCPPWWKRGRP